jgi:hypothetical protein
MASCAAQLPGSSMRFMGQCALYPAWQSCPKRKKLTIAHLFAID